MVGGRSYKKLKHQRKKEKRYKLQFTIWPIIKIILATKTVYYFSLFNVFLKFHPPSPFVDLAPLRSSICSYHTTCSFTYHPLLLPLILLHSEVAFVHTMRLLLSPPTQL